MTISKFEVVLFVLVSVATFFGVQLVEQNEAIRNVAAAMAIAAGYSAVFIHKISHKHAVQLPPKQD